MTESDNNLDKSWTVTLRVSAILAVVLSVLWLISEPGFEPLVGALASIVATLVYFKLKARKHQRILDVAVSFSIVILVTLASLNLLRSTGVVTPNFEIQSAMLFTLMCTAILLPIGVGSGILIKDYLVYSVLDMRTTRVVVDRREIEASLIPSMRSGYNERYPIHLYGTTRIGRDRQFVDVILDRDNTNSPISRLHCTIELEEGGYWIRDEDSANGTFVNGKKLNPLEPIPLRNGDEIELGRMERGGHSFYFRIRKPDLVSSEQNSS